MAPVVWLMGVPWSEASVAGALLGTKTILNEFIAYLDMSRLAPDALGSHAKVIMTYALCGFANPGSLGIMIGGLGTRIDGAVMVANESGRGSQVTAGTSISYSGCGLWRAMIGSGRPRPLAGRSWFRAY